jgi:hypothetical protein
MTQATSIGLKVPDAVINDLSRGIGEDHDAAPAMFLISDRNHSSDNCVLKALRIFPFPLVSQRHLSASAVSSLQKVGDRHHFTPDMKWQRLAPMYPSSSPNNNPIYCDAAELRI